jgi:hypothetical protein
MKHWGILFTILYMALLIVLVGPAIVSFGGDLTEGYEEPFVWIVIAVLVSCQVLLFGVRVDTSTRRLTPQRKLLAPILATTFLLVVMIGLGGWSLWVTVFGERDGPEDELAVVILVALAVSWLSWAVLFWRATRDQDPERPMARMLTWLRRGSVVEILVAVPAHIVARSRGDCCAPAIAGLGICVGLAVMLMVIGPDVFFLYADRINRKRARPPQHR